MGNGRRAHRVTPGFLVLVNVYGPVTSVSLSFLFFLNISVYYGYLIFALIFSVGHLGSR